MEGRLILGAGLPTSEAARHLDLTIRASFSTTFQHFHRIHRCLLPQNATLSLSIQDQPIRPSACTSAQHLLLCQFTQSRKSAGARRFAVHETVNRPSGRLMIITNVHLACTRHACNRVLYNSLSQMSALVLSEVSIKENIAQETLRFASIKSYYIRFSFRF